MSLGLVVTTLSTTATTDPSTAQYDDTFRRALNDFDKLMGQDHKLTDFESPEAVVEVLSKTVQLFDVDGFRAGNQSLKTWLESYVDLLFTVSATLWESTQAVSLTHDSLLSCYCTLTSLSHQAPSPEKTICNAIVVLIEVSLFQKLHARIPVMTIMTIIPRPLIKLTRVTSRLWISSIVFNITSNASMISMISPSSPT
jgi:hypothetical protein